MARHADFDADKVAERLQGQCIMGIDDVVQEMYPGMTELDMNAGDFNEIDNVVFLCEECDWWCEVSEIWC